MTREWKHWREVLKDGLGKRNKMPLRRHRDDDYWDAIDIEVSGPSSVAVRARIEPRYKTSGLSGDEWRISAVLTIEAAGDKAFARPFHRMRGLTEHAPGLFVESDSASAWSAESDHDRSP